MGASWRDRERKREVRDRVKERGRVRDGEREREREGEEGASRLTNSRLQSECIVEEGTEE